MTTLIERCQTVNAKMDELEVARRNASIRALVQARTGEWKESYAKVRSARERASWLAIGGNTPSPGSGKMATFRRNAAEALQRLKSGEDISSLTKDTVWKRLLQAAAGATEAWDEVAKTAWRQVVDDQGTLISPDSLRNQISATPTNDQVIAEYRHAHARFYRLASQVLPRTNGDQAELFQAVELCRALLRKVEYNVPEEVQAFFRAVFANTATLASLTPGVLDWLRDHGHLERYGVRSAT